MIRMGSRQTRKARSKGRLQDPGPYQCHPSVGLKRPAHGCLPVEVLQRAAQQLHVPTSLPPAKLRSELEARLGVNPLMEHSFLSKLPIPDAERATLQRTYLRPVMPAKWKADPDMWLDSLNISDVMNQCEQAFPEFEFMGPFPIDFAAPDPYTRSGGGAPKKCLMNEVCELRVAAAKQNGTTGIGIVYNLDPHFKSGSHWVATYIDLKNSKCIYFDSYGLAPPPQVARFMKWLTTQDPAMTLTYNARRLQYKNTECGMYCLYFLIRMILGDELVDFSRRKPRDEDMLQFRHWLFST